MSTKNIPKCLGRLVNSAKVKTNVDARCDLTGLKLPTVIGLVRMDNKTKCDKPKSDWISNPSSMRLWGHL